MAQETAQAESPQKVKRYLKWRGKKEREPICGFCWRYGVREPLVMNADTREWECPVCERTTISKKNQDELEALEVQLPSTDVPNPYPEAISHSFHGIAKHGGGDRTGRAKKKKPAKGSDSIGYLKE